MTRANLNEISVSNFGKAIKSILTPQNAVKLTCLDHCDVDCLLYMFFNQQYILIKASSPLQRVSDVGRQVPRFLGAAP